MLRYCTFYWVTLHLHCRIHHNLTSNLFYEEIKTDFLSSFIWNGVLTSLLFQKLSWCMRWTGGQGLWMLLEEWVGLRTRRSWGISTKPVEGKGVCPVPPRYRQRSGPLHCLACRNAESNDIPMLSKQQTCLLIFNILGLYYIHFLRAIPTKLS